MKNEWSTITQSNKNKPYKRCLAIRIAASSYLSLKGNQCFKFQELKITVIVMANTFIMRPTILSALHSFTHLIFITTLWGYPEVKKLTQVHTVSSRVEIWTQPVWPQRLPSWTLPWRTRVAGWSPSESLPWLMCLAPHPVHRIRERSEHPAPWRREASWTYWFNLLNCHRKEWKEKCWWLHLYWGHQVDRVGQGGGRNPAVEVRVSGSRTGMMPEPSLLSFLFFHTPPPAIFIHLCN